MSEDGFLCKKVIALPLPWQQRKTDFSEEVWENESFREETKKEERKKERIKGSDNQALFKKKKEMGFCCSERLWLKVLNGMEGEKRRKREAEEVRRDYTHLEILA